MGKTIVEKIFSKKLNSDHYAGDFVITEPDIMFCHEGSGAIAINVFKELNLNNIKYPRRTPFIIDHSAPSINKVVASRHKLVREFVEQYQLPFHDVGNGICHQVFGEEGYFKPGDIVVGGDSHTVTYGALNLFATGIGATELAMAFVSGKVWFKIPSSIKVMFNNKLDKGVEAKDLGLNLIKTIGLTGARYKCLEFNGNLLNDLSIDSRFTISNLSVEMGAKAGIFIGDKITSDWCKSHGFKPITIVNPDEDAKYEKIIQIDASTIEPVVSLPHTIDQIENVKNLSRTRINLGVIGTCTNGRLDDIRTAAKILKNNKISPNVTLLIIPASKRILLKAIKEGLLEILINSGAVIMPPSCGPCMGHSQGIAADGDNIISTQNRNYKGRMGNTKSNIYLASPGTVAASAIKGYITDPREIV